MSIKIIAAGLWLTVFSMEVFGQVSDKSNKDFITYAAGILNFDEFEDSTAIYTCKLQLIVDRRNPSQAVLSTNDSTVTRYIKGLDSLKKFDFISLMGKHRRVAFQMPIAVIVSDSNYGKQCVNANIIADKLTTLHSAYKLSTEGLYVIEMFPLITTLDKKVYE